MSVTKDSIFRMVDDGDGSEPRKTLFTVSADYTLWVNPDLEVDEIARKFWEYMKNSRHRPKAGE